MQLHSFSSVKAFFWRDTFSYGFVSIMKTADYSEERTFTWEAGATLVAQRRTGAVGICVAKDVGMDVGVGFQAYDQPQVRQVHPGCDLAAFVSSLHRTQHQSRCKQHVIQANRSTDKSYCCFYTMAFSPAVHHTTSRWGCGPMAATGRTLEGRR